MTDEKVVAIVDTKATETKDEIDLKNGVENIESQVEELTVLNEQQYSEAGEFGRQIKKQIANVKDFFTPLKKSANDAHKQICKREKEMLAPLQKAEKMLQKSMNEYAMKKAEIARKIEEEAKIAAQKEVDKKLQEAVVAESNGDNETADLIVSEAQIVEQTTSTVSLTSTLPSALPKGVSVKKDYVIEEVTANLVPVDFNGVVIRPVDEKAILKLIKEADGKIQIPGIKFKETLNTTFRK